MDEDDIACLNLPRSSEHARKIAEDFLKPITEREYATEHELQGIVSSSILMQISNFDFVEHQVIDWMHGVCCGFFKSLREFAVSASIFSPEEWARINNIWRTTEIPSFLGRKPRDLQDEFHWKANEIRNFFFFGLLQLMKPFCENQPQNSPKSIFYDICCKSVQIFKSLTSERIEIGSLDAMELQLNEILLKCSNLFGEHVISINFHHLIHYIDCVRFFFFQLNFYVFVKI